MHVIVKLHYWWEWEGLSDVFGEGTRRVELDLAKPPTLVNDILKYKKSWRMRWKRDVDLQEKVKLAFRKGYCVGTPLRGVKHCHCCGTMWDRDVNAARNIGILFWFMRMNRLQRPFCLQRYRDKKTD